MRESITRLLAAGVMLVVFQLIALAQTTGSIAGTVIDSNGSVVPGASIVVRGEAGQEYTVTTKDNGTYNIPSVGAGMYTVTVTAANFKKTVVEGVKVDVATPAGVNVTLEAGDISESVTVTSGAEVLQTQTPTIGSNIQGRQIIETPITSRDALDLVTLLPGTNTTGAARRSTINGLPKGAISITIDGVDVQDNYLRSSDGFFTYVRPRVDAIDEVTVTSAVPGAEAAGDGAVGIRFVTRRGTNNYTGGLFWQHRNTDFNANYWYNNRDGIERQRVILNQFGGRAGGPIPFFNFGEGPAFHSGKDRAFFFINYEEFRYPESLTLNRTVLQPQAQAGNYTYVGSRAANAAPPTDCVAGATPTQMICTRNLYTDVAAGLQLPTTPDPTIAALLSDIRAATSQGTIVPITGDLNREQFRFTSPGNQKRTFLALRFDVNITKNHSIENITNHQKFDSSPDFLNNLAPAFPGFPNYGNQGSTRNSNSTALRSTLTNNIINEARFTTSFGDSAFGGNVTRDMFDNQRGFNLQISGFGITNATVRNGYQFRSSPTMDFTDSVTWVKGAHSFNFGGQYKRIKFKDDLLNFLAPAVYFSGIDSSTDNAAFNAFNTTTLPGASPGQLTEARQLYAVLTGRITQADFWAYQTIDGVYDTSTESGNRLRQDTFGLWVQDQWRIRPNLSLNLGIRWQPQTSYIPLSSNYGRLSDFDQIYGISGPGNIFAPGVMTGTNPTIVRAEPGEPATPTDYNNFAPSIGLVWSPDFSSGFAKSVFGESGRSAFRAGFSRAFVREGTLLLINLLGSNPGGSRVDLRRHSSFGNIVGGTLLRDANNPNLVAPQLSSTTPTFPYAVTQNAGINAFDPDLKTGYVDSFSFGYQREIDRDTVVELRYVGTRGKDLWVQHNLNELNTIENGFASEFALAQANLYANEAAFRAGQTNRRACPAFTNTVTGACQTSATNTTPVNRVPTFQYFGAGTGTSPLPIFTSYLNTPANYLPNQVSAYASNFFYNTTNVGYLSANNPALLTMGATLENLAGARANGVANGRPANFFYANPVVGNGGAFVLRNAERSWYDAAVIEVRRRLSAGLRVSANYVWAKAFTNAYSTSAGNDQVNFVGISLRNPDLQKTTAQHDIRHAFKLDATYDLPFGKGAMFFSGANSVVNGIIGGWSIAPVVRWQSGSPIVMQNVQLVGMTRDELQKEIRVRKDAVIDGRNVVTWLPEDIILNTRRAYDINIANANGYGTQFGGAPEGRFIAPAGYGNCQARYSGECGFANLALYGPSYFKLDLSVMKKIKFGETRNVELKANFFDALNMPNFRVGGWGADTVIIGGGGAAFGQLGAGSAYQDISTTNDPGGRIVEFMLRINL